MQKTEWMFESVEKFIRGTAVVRDMPDRFLNDDGSSMTLNQMIARLKAEFPDTYAEVAHAATQHFRAVRFAPDADLPRMIAPEREEARSRVETQNAELNLTAPEIDHGVTFTTTLDDFDERKKYPNVVEARDAISKWTVGQGKPILYVVGVPGVGKTLMAQAAAIEIIERGDKIAYRTEAKMIGEVRRGMGNRTADTLIDGLQSVPWLVIDDLGTESLTGAMESVRDQIIDARWSGAGPLRTLITTNFARKELPPRIASRLGDRASVRGVFIHATDYRLERPGD